MRALVGFTGFVGSNIAAKHPFDRLYNSQNIASAFGTQPDLLVYAGVPAEIFLANTHPAADLAVCENAADNIRKIAPKTLVLISTISVLDNPLGADEDGPIHTGRLNPYGANRYHLEQLARKTIADCHIIRLPALFGHGLKKNFIYDLIHFLPAMLKADKYAELSEKEPLIAESYTPLENGFYKLAENKQDHPELKAAFERLGFSALNFTDSRSVFQFYPLARLWEHIALVLKQDIPLLHTAVEPVRASELYEIITGNTFVNELSAQPFHYDYRTKYAGLFGGCNGYIIDRETVLRELTDYIRSMQ